MFMKCFVLKKKKKKKKKKKEGRHSRKGWGLNKGMFCSLTLVIVRVVGGGATMFIQIYLVWSLKT